MVEGSHVDMQMADMTEMGVARMTVLALCGSHPSAPSCPVFKLPVQSLADLCCCWNVQSFL